MELGRGRLHLPQELLCPLVKPLAVLGQGQLIPAVGKEVDGEFLFQLPDGPGNGRLGHIQLFGRLGDAAAAYGSTEILQLGQFHGGILLSLNFPIS